MKLSFLSFLRSSLFLITALFFLTGCPDRGDTSYVDFMANATPRWENGSVVQNNTSTTYTYVVDTGNNPATRLFDSDRYKIGRITSPDGAAYEFIEFSGPLEVGKPAGAVIRTPSGTVPLHTLEILKVDGGKVWIAFKVDARAAERRVVQ